MNLFEFQNYLIRKYPQSKTVQNYIERLNNFFTKYSEFNQTNVDKFITELALKNKLNAQKLSIYAFKQYAEYSKIQIIFNKAPRIRTKEKISLTLDEIENELLPYFHSLFQTDANLKIFIFRFMVLTMLRISEVLSLQKIDVNLTDNQINLNCGKGRKVRSVPLHSILKHDLKKHIENSKGEQLFNVNKQYIENIFEVINEKLRYKKHITPHTLRRSGAKAYYQQTKDLEGLQKILGHESIITTQVYIGSNIDDVKENFKNFKYPKRKNI